MKTRIIGILFAGTCVAGSAACVKMEDGDDGADDDGGDGPSTGGGWTAIPLIDDASDPNDILYHAGNDRVTGIHYASLDDGLIVTEGEHDTSNDGGAVFKAAHHEVTSIDRLRRDRPDRQRLHRARSRERRHPQHRRGRDLPDREERAGRRFRHREGARVRAGAEQLHDGA
jgi:hypothetical protein